MKNIMTFEAFAGDPLPVIPAHILCKYYYCPNCNSLHMSTDNSNCVKCNKKCTKITQNEFDIKMRKNLNREEIKEFEKSKEDFMDMFIPLDTFLYNKKDIN